MSKDEYIQVSARIRSCRDSDTKVVFGDESNSQICFRINKNEKLFPFDNVFSENTSQESVFINVGKRIIDGCLAGYNGTIFVYGQTGSGKTYTMFGPAENATIKTQGLIPRCMNYLFERLNSMKEEAENGLTYSVNCSFIQLYNENLYDLLDKVDQRLKIRTNGNGEVFVEGSSTETVMSSGDVAELLRIGLKNRRITETKMNRESSRSHAIFMADISTKYVRNGVINKRSARLNLVDLAGSERQSDSQTAGSALKEATFINKSLLTLTRVIRSLSKNSSQYPGYRDSKLTHLLQDSLGGNTRSSMIINLHPNLSHSDITASTLYFSDSVKRIRNKATVNENIAGENVEVLKKEISRLREENERMKASCETLRKELAVWNAKREEETFRIAELEQETEKMADDGDATQTAAKEKGKLDDTVAASEQHGKLSDAEKKNTVFEKRIAELEKQLADCKVALKKRENSIEEYEQTLTYKARRLDQTRMALDEMQKRITQLDEENSALKKEVDFQRFTFEKERMESIENAKAESRSEIDKLHNMLKEVKAQRDEAQQKLSDLTGHNNTKQKISYVNQLREKIAILESENEKLKDSGSLILRKRSILRPRGNSQPPAKVSASAAPSTSAFSTGKVAGNALPPKK